MTRNEINALCASLKGSEWSDPWGGGHDCWKIGGKMYLVNGALADGGVTLKCPDQGTADMLIAVGAATRSPYLPRGGWVRMPWGAMAADDLEARVRAAYDTVRATLPKRLRTAR